MEQICLPFNIIRNFNLSPRARIIWAELSVLPRNEAGHFVVKTKEFSREIGVCASTTRRALKTLLEQKLIEQVGVFERHHKVFQFVNTQPVDKPVDKSGPSGGSSGPKPQPTPPPTPPEPKPEPKPEPAPQVQIVTPALVLPVPAKIEAPALITTKAQLLEHREACQAARPARRQYMGLCFKLGRPITKEDEPKLKFADFLFKLNHGNARRNFPLLNGLNGHPRLDENMYIYAVYNDPEHVGDAREFFKYLNPLFEEFSQTPFVPHDNMVIKYFDI